MRSVLFKLLVLGVLLAGLGFNSGWAADPVLVSIVDFNDNDGGFTVVTTNAPPGPWSWSDVTGTWSCFDSDGCITPAFRGSRLNSPILTVVAPGPLAVTFEHRYSWEADTTRWDGGQFRISVNGGAYTNVPDALFMAEGYNNTIGGASVPNSEIAGQRAFTATSTGYSGTNYLTTEVILGPFNSNDTVAIQFLAAWDDCSQGSVPNWEINRVVFTPALEDRRSAPVFTDPSQPADVAILQGRSHVLQATVFGIPVPTLQWYKDALLIPGQTNSTYSIPFATPLVDDGLYYVIANNSQGSATSRVATVTVTPDTEGPLWVRGMVLANGSLMLSWSEVMSNTYDPFIAFVYETANPDNQFFLADNALQNGTNLTFNTVNPDFVPEPLTAGVNYSIFIGVGAFRDQFDNGTPQSEPNMWEGTYGPGIVRSLAGEITIADYGTEWSYFPLYGQPGAELITSSPPFYSLAFDDSAWPKGLPPFGVENPLTTMPDNLDVVTPVQNTGSGGPITTYYRLRFDLPSPAEVVSMRLVRVLYDDGFVVYLNGVEVGRAGVAADQNSQTIGTSHQASAYSGQAWALPTTNLYEADNILAVELHNTSTTSTDNIWAAELRAVVPQITVNPPVITEQTQGPVNLNEGQRLTLSVTASGTRPLSYQWRLGGSPILNATNASYGVASVTTANAGTYTCVVGNSGGSDTSDPILVNVTADIVPPTVVSALAALVPTTIEINFSEPVTALTATNPANYGVAIRAGGGDLTITRAALNNGTNVVLTTSARMVENYRLTVRNITDLAAAANPINPNPTLWDLPSEVILVDHAAFGQWRYNDTIDTAPPVDWATPAFDATSWKTGLPLFYGKRGTPGNTSIPTLTTLNLSNALNTAQLTSVYFRVSINLTAGQVANTPLKFQYILDDGAVFYANGTEVLRTGMPATPTPPLNGTLASRTIGNDMLWEAPIVFNSAPLSAGANTFAAEVHQSSATSSDLAFALRLIGTQATIVPPLRITSISLETPGNAPIPNVIIRHNGADVPGDEYVQETTALADPPAATIWVTRPGGPHASPHNAGPATGTRFFRLKDRP